MERRRRIGLGLVAIAAVTLGTGIPVAGQTPKQVTESLCTLLTRKQVRDAFGQKVGSSDQEPGKCYWGIVDQGAYGGPMQLEMRWEPFTFDDLALVSPDATETTVGGRRARLAVREGDVVAVGEGQVKRDIYTDLVLDLDQGPLGLYLTDVKGQDRQATLTGLGELAVANGAGLVAPPPLDPTLASLVPATLGDDPTLIQRVLFPGQEFCSRCDFGKALRAALEAQGKTMTDVSMLTAATAAQSGPSSIAQPTIRALRVPGADPAPFVDPMIGYLFGGSGVTPERTDGTGVVAVTRRGDQYNPEWTAVLYPHDDILWVVTAPEALRAEVLAALPGAPVAPPIPTPAPTPTPDLSTPEGYLTSLMPGSVGGEPLTLQSGGNGWIANFDDKTIKWAQAELKKDGKTLDDLSSMLAYNTTGTNILAMRVPDVDVNPLVDLVVGSYRSMGAIGKKTKAEPVDLAGRSAFSLKAQGQTLYLYPKDDVLFLVQVPDDAALLEVFAALP